MAMPGVIQHSCHCTEVTADEYLRLSNKKPPDERWGNFMKEKRRLQQLSIEKANRWPNTLVNLRLLREKARQERLAKEEIQKQKMDVEEAATRHKIRLDAIGKANSVLEKPHIKVLQSKALIDNVNKERAEQVKLKEAVKESWKEKEHWYHEQMLKDLAAANKEEDAKTKKRHNAVLELGKDRKAQMDETHHRYLEMLRQKQLDKENFQKEEEAKLKNDIVLAEKKRQKIARIYREFEAFNQSLMDKKSSDNDADNRVNKDIENFLNFKKTQRAELKKKSDLEKKLKNEAQDRAVARLEAHLKAKQQKDAGNMEKERKAKELADDRALAMDLAKKKQNWDLCHKSRQIQLEKKRKDAEMEKEDANYEADIANKQIMKVLAEEKMTEIQTYNRNREFADYLQMQKKRQMDEKNNNKKMALEEDANAALQLILDEDYLRNLKFG